MIEHGYTPEWVASTFDYFERSGSSVYYHIHDLLKLYKLGYSKVTDHLSREIRHGRVSKSEAIEIKDHYMGAERDYTEFFDWLGVSGTGRMWLEQWILNFQQKSSLALPNPDIPPQLAAFCKKSIAPKETFIVFDKGIYLRSQKL